MHEKPEATWTINTSHLTCLSGCVKHVLDRNSIAHSDKLRSFEAAQVYDSI